MPLVPKERKVEVKDLFPVEELNEALLSVLRVIILELEVFNNSVEASMSLIQSFKRIKKSINLLSDLSSYEKLDLEKQMELRPNLELVYNKLSKLANGVSSSSLNNIRILPYRSFATKINKIIEKLDAIIESKQYMDKLSNAPTPLADYWYLKSLRRMK
jgi:DNA repair exonuclease SbcCD ATPase subunit